MEEALEFIIELPERETNSKDSISTPVTVTSFEIGLGYTFTFSLIVNAVPRIGVQSFVFSIDVDDQLINSELGQIRVSGGELNGSQLAVEFVHSDGSLQTVVAEFKTNNRANINVGEC